MIRPWLSGLLAWPRQRKDKCSRLSSRHRGENVERGLLSVSVPVCVYGGGLGGERWTSSQAKKEGNRASLIRHHGGRSTRWCPLSAFRCACLLLYKLYKHANHAQHVLSLLYCHPAHSLFPNFTHTSKPQAFPCFAPSFLQLPSASPPPNTPSPARQASTAHGAFTSTTDSSPYSSRGTPTCG